MIYNYFRKNIYLSVALILFVGIALPTTMIGLVEFNQVESDIMNEAQLNIKNSTSLMALGLSRAVWDYSKENIDPVVRASLLNESVKSVIVFDSNKKKFYEVKSKNAANVSVYSFVATEKIFYNDREIGTLEVAYDFTNIHNKLQYQLKHLLLLRIFSILLILFFLLWFLHFGFITRIKRLISNAKNLVARNLDVPFDWKSGDPLNSLGMDLEEARKSLKSLFAEVSLKNNELSKLNLDLENLVKEKSLQVVHSARMAALGEMAAGIAHEINNPLSVISGRATQIERGLRDGREMSHENLISSLFTINKMSNRIAKIVKSLKFFSRNSENDIMKNTPLTKIFEDTLDLCQERMKNLEIDFNMSSIPDLEIECRNVQLSQVILNLINNASDAVRNFEIKWIYVDIIEQKNFIKICVIDSGAGISPELVEKIMLPFFTTKGVDQGTGLGLSISSGIIEDHGGKLYVDKDSKSTCFTIDFPKKQRRNLNE